MIAPATTILWAATAHGYTVQTMRGSKIVDEYHAGNHAMDSQQYATIGSREAVPANRLRKMAERTANDIAEENGSAEVEYDSDLESELFEIFQQRV